jgi:hypothetical protein
LNPVQKARGSMVFSAPTLHGQEGFLRVVNGDIGPFGNDCEVVVGNDRGDFKDDTRVGIEPRHFQVHPDETAVCFNHHGAFISLGETAFFGRGF